jgi:DNA-binding protein HU-beta
MKNVIMAGLAALIVTVLLGADDAGAMNKAELVERVAAKTDLSRADAQRAVDAVLNTLVDAVGRDNKVKLVGFGTFTASKRSGRTGTNPETGEQIKIAPSRYPKTDGTRSKPDEADASSGSGSD